MYLSALNKWSDCWFTTGCRQRPAKNRAVAGKPHVRCRCKIRYVRKIYTASRGSPCDSTAFLFIMFSLQLGN